jgi:hypothetical protein
MRIARNRRTLPPFFTDLLSEAAGQSRRADRIAPRTGGPAGNARLTAWTGLVLLVLSLAELVTLLDVRGLISWHVVVGVLLVPPALLKTVTTGWRIVRYYRGGPAYSQAGPPPLLLRILGPAVVASTLGLLGSGLALIALGQDASRRAFIVASGLRVDAITLHQGLFVAWAVATGLHVLGRFVPALRLTVATPAAEPDVPGASRRALIFLVMAAIAATAGPLVLFASGSWQSDSHEHDGGQGAMGKRILLRRASAAATAPVAAPAPAAPTRLARAALRPVR